MQLIGIWMSKIQSGRVTKPVQEVGRNWVTPYSPGLISFLISLASCMVELHVVKSRPVPRPVLLHHLLA